MRDISLYLRDIREAMLAAEKFVEGLSFEEFRIKYPQIPWKEIAGMRDRLIHFYFGIKYELVWHTIEDVIPVVRPVIQKILTDINK